MLGILLLISFIIVLITNVITRVGLDISAIQVYQYIPEKYKMKNKKLLKLYLCIPKSIVTKSGFTLYVTQLIMFVILLILFIVQFATNIFSEEIIYIICVIYGIITGVGFLLSYGFDFVISLIYKNQLNNNFSWETFCSKFIDNKEDFIFKYQDKLIILQHSTSNNKYYVSCQYLAGDKILFLKTFKNEKELLKNAIFDGKLLKDIFYQLER